MIIDLQEALKELQNPLQTLYIGGGTPSSVEATLYHKLFKIINPKCNKDTEKTIEANPNSLTLEWLHDMRDFGINRLSIGIQSFDKHKLQFLGRAHSQKEALLAVELAHKAGIKNISIDCIYGTALDTPSLFQNEFALIKTLDISHISAYALTIEENTPFFHTPQVCLDDENLARHFIEGLKNLGFDHYEISNFCKNSAFSKHNLSYWKYHKYIGVGCGAVGFDGVVRYTKHKDFHTYLLNPKEIFKEHLSDEDIFLEKLFLGLRSCVGVDMNILNKAQKQRAQILIDEKKLTQKNNRLFNNDFLLADEITLFIQC